MKRIIAFMLGVMLAFSSGNIVLAEAADNVYEVERSLNILKAIGQFSDYDMTTVETNKEITRGEFSVGLAELLKLTVTEDKLYYHDVSKEHFAYDGITALTEAGYMNGYGDNIFKPEQIMTKAEAATVLVVALGYKTEAVTRGGTEGVYVQIADRLELFDSTGSNTSLTFGDMLIMLKNTLIAPMTEITYSGTNVTYVESDENMLSVYYDSHYSEKERVTYANNTGIYAEKEGKNEVTIGSRNYLPISENMEDYLGSYVNFIYKGDPKEDICQIIWIEKDNHYDELVLYEEDIDGFDSSDYTYSYYTDNGRTKKISLSRNISVIYNGCFESDSEKFLKLPCTEIRFLENKDGEYDTAIISNYVNYVIDAVYMTEEVFTVRQGNERINIAQDDYKKFLVLDEEKNVISVDDLTSDATVSVFESYDGDYIKFIVSEKTTEGVLEAVSNTSDDSVKVRISGEEYRLSSSVNVDDIPIGNNVFVYLDYNNNVSYIKKDLNDGYLAYIIRVALEIPDKIKIKAFNQDGEVKMYDTSRKLKVDDDSYTEPDSNEFDALVNSIENQLVLLEFDDEGKIKNIDTPQGSGEIEIDAPFASCGYRGVSPKIGRLTCIDSSTKIFSIPSDPKTADDYEFQIKNKGELGDWRTFYAQSYRLTDETDYAGAVLIQGFKWNAPTDTSVVFIYEDSREAVNEDGDITTVITGLEITEEKEYFCEPGYEPENLTVGCAVFLDLNEKNEICNMEPVFDRKSEGGESNTNITGSRRMIVGHVNRIKGNVISIGYTDPSVIDERFDCTGTPIIVVDESARKDYVTVGSIADIISYENSTTEYSKVGIQTVQMSQKMIVVYK